MNILFITADQWRGECLSSLGHPVVKTPHLDALAAEGVTFTNHFAQTTPCGPSRTSIHTGTYQFNHRCVSNGTPVSRHLTNWALEVRRAGYDPSLFGYTDTAADPHGIDPGDPRLRHYSEPLPGVGFHTPIRNEVSLPWVEYLSKTGYTIPERWWDLYGETRNGQSWHEGGEGVLPLKIRAEDHETHFMVDLCRDWIASQTRPWITHLSLLRPHPPFAAPEPYNTLYPPDEAFVPVRSEHRADTADQHPWLDYYVNHSTFSCPDDLRLLQERRALYYGLMTEVDDNLGRLFQFLKDNGEWDETLIIFTSDHGEQMGDYWLMSKLGFHDASYHVPLIVRDPSGSANVSRGDRITRFTEHVDLMPTLLDQLGLEVPSQCDGRSLRPLIEQGDAEDSWRKFAFWEYDFRDLQNQHPEQHFGLPSRACNLAVIRTAQHKYVHFAAMDPLLFDLARDPGELNNLACDADYQSVRLDLASRLVSHRMLHERAELTETILTEKGPFVRPDAR